ncbi:unnamed protein product, partial [marine sediment metagenome]
LKYLRSLKEYKIFSGNQMVSINDLFTGIHHFKLLKGIPDECKKLFSYLLLRKISNFLKSKESISINPTDHEKFRILVFIDEAQFLLESKAKKIVEKITAEDRKFGLSLILASQSIGNFDEKILKNISTKLLMFPGTQREVGKYKKIFGVSETLFKTLNRKEGYYIFDNQYPIKRVEL